MLKRICYRFSRNPQKSDTRMRFPSKTNIFNIEQTYWQYNLKLWVLSTPKLPNFEIEFTPPKHSQKRKNHCLSSRAGGRGGGTVSLPRDLLFY